MSNEAERRARELKLLDSENGSKSKFFAADLESVTGSYDTVACVDVAIHYPNDKMAQMVAHLCSLSKNRVIFSFAPKRWYFVALKKIGEFFPGPSKTTRAYLHEEKAVRDVFERAGFDITREDFTGTNFYFSKVLEATRKG
jgi:magnesium-protoporphyrin O-methyltransferase